MKRKILAACLAVLSAVPAIAEPFSNDSVMALSNAGIGNSVLLAKVNSLPCAYDVSTAAIIRLKSGGVSDEVIAAMVDRCTNSGRAQGADDSSSDPLVKRTPGLYVNMQKDEKSVLHVIRPTLAAGVRYSGNGSIVFPFMARLDVPQSAAQTALDTPSPVFYFYFEATDRKVGDFGEAGTGATQSPAEFSLVRFKVGNGIREMTLGKVSPFQAQIGIDPKNTIAFSQTEVGDGIFKAETSSPLAKGQYAFILKGGKGSYRIYDFEVK